MKKILLCLLLFPAISIAQEIEPLKWKMSVSRLDTTEMRIRLVCDIIPDHYIFMQGKDSTCIQQTSITINGVVPSDIEIDDTPDTEMDISCHARRYKKRVLLTIFMPYMPEIQGIIECYPYSHNRALPMERHLLDFTFPKK